MSDSWQQYFCNVNDKLASVLVDVGIHESVPDAGRPWLLWVWVYLKNPRPDGLPSGEEFETLSSIEDRLTSDIERRCQAVLSGRISTDGRKEFYFYGADAEGFEDTVSQSMTSFQRYSFERDKQQDPGWRQYLDVLYPSKEQLQLIWNRRVLETLKSHGDTLASAREVEHLAYFRSDSDRIKFEKVVQGLGYRIDSETAGEGEFSHEVRIVKMLAMNEESVDQAVIELQRASKVCHGEYDGWESPVVADLANKLEKPWWKLW